MKKVLSLLAAFLLLLGLFPAAAEMTHTAPEPIDLHDKKFRVYARNSGMLPQYLAEGSSVTDCLVTEGCDIEGTARHSILSSGVRLMKNAVVEDSVIMPGAVIHSGAVIRRAIIAENAVIGEGVSVGEAQGEIAVVGAGITVPAGSRIPAGEQFEG